jgi:hypothetical protein
MKPSEIREELLRQHAEIRIMTEVTLTSAKGVLDGIPGRGNLHHGIMQLADAVHSHNLREEELLGEVIPSVDAWGTARAEIMTEQHVEEHARLNSVLRGISSAPLHAMATEVLELVRIIREHMDREEASFLGEDVLRDDIVVTDPSDG